MSKLAVALLPLVPLAVVVSGACPGIGKGGGGQNLNAFFFFSFQFFRGGPSSEKS